MKKILTYVFWIGIYLSVGFAIGMSTESGVQGWYQTLEKPSFNPPNWIFPIMWSFLYILIATAGCYLWRVGAPKSLKSIFIAYTLLNWAWSPIFFGMEQTFVALVWITALNLVNITFIAQAWKRAKLSAYLMILPLFWTLFASVLNYAIWSLNS